VGTRIHHIRHAVKEPAPRWTFEVGMRETTREVLVVLWYEADEQMVHS
jgi:hypothetical protein